MPENVFTCDFEDFSSRKRNLNNLIDNYLTISTELIILCRVPSRVRC